MLQNLYPVITLGSSFANSYTSINNYLLIIKLKQIQSYRTNPNHADLIDNSRYFAIFIILPSICSSIISIQMALTSLSSGSYTSDVGIASFINL